MRVLRVLPIAVQMIAITITGIAVATASTALLARGETVSAADLDLPSAPANGGSTSNEEPDRAVIEAALERNGGVLAQAAADLGLSRQALYRRLDRLGIARN